jgi:Tol biopolymer transport system component
MNTKTTTWGTPWITARRTGVTTLTTKRLLSVSIVAILAAFGVLATAGPVPAKAAGPNGQIAFAREATPPDSGHVTNVVNPDGSGLRSVAEPADFPRWSPDGSRLALGDMDCMFGGACAAVILNVDTGATTTLPDPTPARFDEFFGCTDWSPDGTRLACGGLGDAPGTSGVYTLRSTDGGDLTEVLACDNECGPADYSPDGRQLVLTGDDSNGQTQLFVVGITGNDLQQITFSDSAVDVDSGASWSPRGDLLLFSRHPDADHRRAIFEVDADGTDLHQVPVPGCGGAFADPTSVACFGPSWSPDGTRFAFARASAKAHVQNIYTVNADGTDPRQVTRKSSGLEVTNPDWGTHPTTQ